MDKKQALLDRASLISKTIRQEKTDRIPIMSNAWTWKVYDAGMGLKEGLYDIHKFKDAMRHYFEEYPTDFMYETGSRNPFSFTQFFGSDTHYIIDDEKKVMSLVDESYFDASEYDELISDPMKFIWEKFLPRKCPKIASEKNGKTYLEGLWAFVGFLQGFGEINAMLAEEFAVPVISSATPIHNLSGYDILFNFMRGIKGISIDIRRCPDKVLAAAEALERVFYKDLSTFNGPKGSDPVSAVDAAMTYLGASILSPKQFDKFYLPYLKEVSKFCEDYDKTVLIFAEGENKRFYDRLNDVPKGHFAIVSEIDDIFEIKKALPNMCVGGGMPTTLLGKASVEECVDRAKLLVDRLGPEGGYIFTEDKMMSFYSDCKPENLKAVCEYVAQQRI